MTVALYRPCCDTASDQLCGVDRETLSVVEGIIEDLLDCLERWQRTGYDDWQWVAEYWTRRVEPSTGVALAPPVGAATDAAAVHRALLAWQEDVIAHLL